MRPALISGGASGKKASIHFQCFDPHTFSIPSIYPALSSKDSPRNPRFSLSPPSLPFIWDKKDEKESTVTMEERHVKGKKHQELGHKRMGGTRHERETVRASMDWLYRPANRARGGLLEGNQADNPINKLAGIHMPRVRISSFSI